MQIKHIMIVIIFFGFPFLQLNTKRDNLKYLSVNMMTLIKLPERNEYMSRQEEKFLMELCKITKKSTR